VLASGCLSSSYEIPRTEVDRLLTVPPAERGKSVRAVQRFSVQDSPPPAPAWYDPAFSRGSTTGVHAEGPSVGYHYYYHAWGNPYWEPAPVTRISPATDPGGGGALVPAPGPTLNRSPPAPSNPFKNAERADTRAMLAAVVAAAVVVGIALAVSEGARYDGTVAVHPHHPLHLMGPNGEHSVVGLDDLEPRYLAPQTRVLLVGTEGAGMWHRGRAPLDREGFVYRVGLGTASLYVDRDTMVTANGADLALGFFPSQYAGFLFNFGVLTGQGQGGDLWSIRPSFEGHVYPLPLWRLHLGGFGAAGVETYSLGGGWLPEAEGNHPFVDFGPAAELELTTRLALNFKLGWHWAPREPWNDRYAPFYAIGLSVY
jgi:hypothetical protein